MFSLNKDKTSNQELPIFENIIDNLTKTYQLFLDFEHGSLRYMYV